METRMNLLPADFTGSKRLLLTFGDLRASTFRFSSGVAAVRLESGNGALVLLPYQGQQVWSAELGAPGVAQRNLTMRSMVEEPQPTREFLHTFGGFLQHCGVTAVGNPSEQDQHPLHGELPNAPFQTAYLVSGEDERGPYIGLGGTYRHTVAFLHNYLAEPRVRLHAGASRFEVEINITNLKQSAMEVYYLAHVNFQPVDNSRLVYSAPSTPEHVRVRATIPRQFQPAPGYEQFIHDLEEEPVLHEVLRPDLVFNPEVVLFVDYLADAQGWAHTMQVHPDGTADYIGHRPDQLPKATRWISRTPDQDAVALVEAGTSEPEGYFAEKAKGNFRLLSPGERFHAVLKIGVLGSEEAGQLEQEIARTVANNA